MSQLRQSLRLLLAAILTLTLAHYLQWNERYWMVISVLLGLQMSSDLELRQKDFFLLLTGLLAALAACVTSLLALNVIYLALFLFLNTALTVIVGLRRPLLWGCAFLINIFAALSAGFPTGFVGMQERFRSIFLGFFIAVLLQKIFFPNRLRADARLALSEAIQELIELNQAVFNCYLAVDYPTNQFVYTKKLHEKRREFSSAISIARDLVKKIKVRRDNLLKILCTVEQLFEIIQSLGTLINREQDHSTFQIINKELLAIAENIHTELRAIKIYLLKRRHAPAASEILQENIYQLDDVNHSATYVAAQDPLAFLLFVQDLYALQAAMQKLVVDISLLAGDKFRWRK
jgi:uncharacterized membrane protein YccC